jgi:hypothetical protein
MTKQNGKAMDSDVDQTEFQGEDATVLMAEYVCLQLLISISPQVDVKLLDVNTPATAECLSFEPSLPLPYLAFIPDVSSH